MPQLTLHPDRARHRISRHIYGHFAEHLGRCVYDGLYVGEASSIPNTRGWRNDLVAALNNLHIPNLRWPGGCFADTYHWQDGIGPKPARPEIVNVHWGGVTENNHVGTHEFLDLCDQLGCAPYIAANVGSGTVREMAQWLEYLTMPGKSPMADLRRANGRDRPWDIRFWGVGNENWGCGGHMRVDYYADLYRQYASYCRHYGGGRLYKVACGFDDPWNDRLLELAARFIDGLSIHHYTVPGTWERKGSATRFTTAEYLTTLRKALDVDDFLRRTTALLDKHDPAGRIGIVLDEWGAWYDVEPGTNPGFLYQQNTLRDALVAAVSFNSFHAHVPRLHMANIAQTVNVLQALALTDGPRMLLTPTYHAFALYRGHHDAVHIPLTASDVPDLPTDGGGHIPRISATASRSDDGRVHVNIAHLHPDQPVELTVDLAGVAGRVESAAVLAADTPDAHNTFEQPDRVRPVPLDVASRDGQLHLKLRPHSLAAVTLR
ncbi:MAG: alpha-N-arabinofuranosidase [Tepidisphaerales bacterium]